MKEKIIKSKERVKKFAEVYTPVKVVRQMCNMLEEESNGAFDIYKTFLEPACGNGNFLVEIFSRKLKFCNTVNDGLNALISIYGIDIQSDNVEESRGRLFELFIKAFPKATVFTGIAAEMILERNIICGDSLKIMEMLEQMEWNDMLEKYYNE